MDSQRKEAVHSMVDIEKNVRYAWATVALRDGMSRNMIIGRSSRSPQKIAIRELDMSQIKVDRKLCYCGSGKQVKQCHQEIRENSAMAYLFEAFRIIEQDIAASQPRPTCECKANDCCYDMFEVSFCEYLAIITHLQQSHMSYRKHRRARQKAEELRPLFPDYGESSKLSGCRLSRPCIFLDNRGKRCLIYEVRPLLCRTYGYYEQHGNCRDAKHQHKSIPSGLGEAMSTFLGGTPTENGIKKPLAAQMVYWFGGRHPIIGSKEFQKMFIATCNDGIERYVELSIHLGHREWFK